MAMHYSRHVRFYCDTNPKEMVDVETLSVFATRSELKSDWGTLVPRINVGNGIKLGFLLE
jgi:hypothetical protein